MSRLALVLLFLACNRAPDDRPALVATCAGDLGGVPEVSRDALCACVADAIIAAHPAAGDRAGLGRIDAAAAEPEVVGMAAGCARTTKMVEYPPYVRANFVDVCIRAAHGHGDAGRTCRCGFDRIALTVPYHEFVDLEAQTKATDRLPAPFAAAFQGCMTPR